MIGLKHHFYTNVQGYPYPGYEYQDYKDKGFNLKLRLKQEGKLPAIAVGFMISLEQVSIAQNI